MKKAAKAVIFTIADIDRLRGEAQRGTHLARYELAVRLGAKRVLGEPCPDCGAAADNQCDLKELP